MVLNSGESHEGLPMTVEDVAIHTLADVLHISDGDARKRYATARALNDASLDVSDTAHATFGTEDEAGYRELTPEERERARAREATENLSAALAYCWLRPGQGLASNHSSTEIAQFYEDALEALNPDSPWYDPDAMLRHETALNTVHDPERDLSVAFANIERCGMAQDRQLFTALLLSGYYRRHYEGRDDEDVHNYQEWLIEILNRYLARFSFVEANRDAWGGAEAIMPGMLSAVMNAKAYATQPGQDEDVRQFLVERGEL